MIHDGFSEVKSGKDEGVIRAKNKWVLDDSGEVVCTDERTIRIKPVKERTPARLRRSRSRRGTEVVFGDDKDGTMAIRLAETMRVQRGKAKGEKTAPPARGTS